MTWSQAQIEAQARADSSTVLKWAFEIRHSLFPSIVRIVNHDLDCDFTLEATAPVDAGTTQTFVGTSIRFKEPDLNGEPDPTVKIDIDGVSGTLQPFIKPAVASGEPILLTLRGYMYNTRLRQQVQALRIYNAEMRRALTNMTTISATFGYTNAATQTFPNQKYDAITNPGLA
ncbi:MAG: DUF1833 domain-containing protein [Pseudomonadaceae bacterium]|nr:DUF1833 domain-containing protein [Pseudomonadaceae bacterium]